MHLAKKAAIDTVIIPLVLLLIAGIALFALVNRTGNVLNSSSQIEVCRFSVLEKARFIIKGVDLGDVKLKCPIEKVNILDKKDEKAKGERNIVVDSQEDVMEAVANEMYDCWYKFGEGKVDFVGNIGKITNTKVCYICSDIMFGERLSSNTKIGGEIMNFEKYLYESEVPLSNESYYNYFLGNIKYQDQERGEINIRTDKQIAVTYNVVDYGLWPELLLAYEIYQQPAKAVAAAYFRTDSVFITAPAIRDKAQNEIRMFMEVKPVDELPKYCEDASKEQNELKPDDAFSIATDNGCETFVAPEIASMFNVFSPTASVLTLSLKIKSLTSPPFNITTDGSILDNVAQES